MEIINIELDVDSIMESVKEETVRVFPWRSAMTVPEGVKDYITGKSLCDIGCAEGDMLQQFSKYADSVVGIELDSDRFRHSIERGLKVICGNFFRIREADFPVTDVYYLWGIRPDTSMLMVDHIMKHPKVKDCVILTSGRQNANHVQKSVKKHDGKILSIPYREFNDDLQRVENSRLWVGVIEKKTGADVLHETKIVVEHKDRPTRFSLTSAFSKIASKFLR